MYSRIQYAAAYSICAETSTGSRITTGRCNHRSIVDRRTDRARWAVEPARQGFLHDLCSTCQCNRQRNRIHTADRSIPLCTQDALRRHRRLTLNPRTLVPLHLRPKATRTTARRTHNLRSPEFFVAEIFAVIHYCEHRKFYAFGLE